MADIEPEVEALPRTRKVPNWKLRKRANYKGPVHVILHPGFHKTGTTSTQTYLYHYVQELRLYGVNVVPRNKLEPMWSVGRIFWSFPNFFTYWSLKRGVRKALKDVARTEYCILTRESISGAIPGQRMYGMFRKYRYGFAGRINAKVMVRELKRKFGEDTKITIVYTVRDQEAWIKSVWGHLVRGSGLRMDFDEFAAKMRREPTLSQEVDLIRKAMGDQAEVVEERLEIHAKGHFGPAGALLKYTPIRNRFGANRDAMPPRLPGDPPELQAKFLEINRRSRNKAKLQIAKDKMREEWLQSLGKIG